MAAILTGVAGATPAIRTQSEKHHLSRQRARALGTLGFLAACALPFVLWHRAIALVATDFRLEVDYLVTGWTGYGLIALGLAFMLPVVISIGRRPTSRLYPRARNAYAAWGLALYVLGIALASQVAQVLEITSGA